MNQGLRFKTIPLEVIPEVAGEEFEVERERGIRRPPTRPRGYSARPGFHSGLRATGSKRPLFPVSRPCSPFKRLRRPFGGALLYEPYPVVSEPYPAEPDSSSGSERVRWLQDCLNQAAGMQLPVTGVMGTDTRSAVRSFQRQQGLRVSGIAGPDTEEALRSACESRNIQPSVKEMESGYESEWMEMELLAAFRDNYSKLLRHMSPADQKLWATRRCYRLSQYRRVPRQRGVYLLVFRNRSSSGHIGYVGETGNLYDRMQGYHRDVISFGLNPDNYSFCWVLTPQHKAIEANLRTALNPTGLITNQRELELAFESPFSEAEELELAAELLAISSEEELDLFLGKLFKGIGRGLKKFGRFVGKKVLPALGRGLKAIGKVALPIVGKALGSFIPIPGVGTAIGGAIGTAVSKALELEFSGLPSEEAELEMARRFVRIAATAARQAALADPRTDPETIANAALTAAARMHVPNLSAVVRGGNLEVGDTTHREWHVNSIQPRQSNQEAFLGDAWNSISTGARRLSGGVINMLHDCTPIEDRTSFTPKDKRKGKPRDMSKVYALVLHQTAGNQRNTPPDRYDGVTAHFVIKPNGQTLQLHPLTARLNASNGFNAGSVAVEFAGNFPDTRGKRYVYPNGASPQGVLTAEQIKAGRCLIRYLVKNMDLTHILAHRQSSASRENDPGPDIWYHVGQWAINNLGLRDGGQNFKIGSGNPIPDSWRTWGKAKQPELGEELFV